MNKSQFRSLNSANGQDRTPGNRRHTSLCNIFINRELQGLCKLDTEIKLWLLKLETQSIWPQYQKKRIKRQNKTSPKPLISLKRTLQLILRWVSKRPRISINVSALSLMAVLTQETCLQNNDESKKTINSNSHKCLNQIDLAKRVLKNLIKRVKFRFSKRNMFLSARRTNSIASIILRLSQRN